MRSKLMGITATLKAGTATTAARIPNARNARLRLALFAAVGFAVLAGAVGPARSAFPGANGEIAYTRNGELFLLAGGPVTALAGQPVENPAWSPDGTKIAFGSAGQLLTYDVASQDVQFISQDGPYDQPAWSPDGTTVAFARFDQGQQGIWRMNADGTNVIRLTDGGDSNPAWSPDGGTIAFARGVPLGQWQYALKVYAMNPDGSGQVRVREEGSDEQDPAWSPHGDELAFVIWSGNPHIGVMKVNNPGFTKELSSPASDFGFSPAWSPDGSNIVYAGHGPSSSGNDRELFSVLADGSGSPVQLTENDGFDETPDWQPLPAPPGTSATCLIGSTRIDEGDGATAPATFEVDYDNPTSDTYSVSYSTSDGTAVDASDYIPTSGSLSVSPGKTHADSKSAAADCARSRVAENACKKPALGVKQATTICVLSRQTRTRSVRAHLPSIPTHKCPAGDAAVSAILAIGPSSRRSAQAAGKMARQRSAPPESVLIRL